jgi:hypothetical protein
MFVSVDGEDYKKIISKEYTYLKYESGEEKVM